MTIINYRGVKFTLFQKLVRWWTKAKEKELIAQIDHLQRENREMSAALQHGSEKHQRRIGEQYAHLLNEPELPKITETVFIYDDTRRNNVRD